ncbi:hypothetical protein [Rheinheimera sp. UJ63]|uniref:hypothetical protein n=1 Tax=Rheinheimera sp. UJ63 TaxID=2910157 RepID=UPI001F3479CB|nr:hypothetical protein [Rheinheimera sp. UJ63]MCF4009932.1 hypothetical protein [Rheinheimera sp. UJ63]
MKKLSTIPSAVKAKPFYQQPRIMFAIWLFLSILYLVYRYITDQFWLVETFYGLLWLSYPFWLPQLFKGPKPLVISDPRNYVRFNAEQMLIGEANIEIKKVQKVALDVVEQQVYFSLPFNSNKLPSFVFAVEQLEDFKAHLVKGLGKIDYV